MKGRVETLGILSLILVMCFSSLAFATSYGLTPADNEWTTNATSGISFSYNRTANLNGSVTCELLVDVGQTGSFVVANESTTCTNNTIYAVTSGVTISEGLTNWKVRSFNGTAEETSSVKTLKVDRTAPVIAVNTAEVTWFNTSGVGISITPSDNLGTMNCTTFLSGIASNISYAVVNASPKTSFVYGVADGAHNWSIRCQDQAGNVTNTNTYNITVDTAVPATVTISAPVTNTWISTGTFTLTAKYTDLIAATANCSVYLDGALWVSQTADNNTNEDFTITPSPQEGNHSVYVTCKDGALNANSSTTIYVPIDKTTPTVSMGGSGSPANGTIATTTSYTFNWTYTDTQDGSIGCNMTLDDTVILNATTTNNSYATVTKTGISAGNHTWYVNCTDDSGRVGQSGTRWFYVDSAAPTISFAVVNSTGAINMSGYINATVTDAATNIDTCYYTIFQPNGSQTNKTATISGSGKTKYCYISFTPSDFYGTGQIDFQLTANDTLGNQVQSNSSYWTIISLAPGWNLIQGDINGTIGTYNYTGLVTKVSYYNNTNHTYTTWTQGTSTNQNQTFEDGDGVFVYATATTYLIRYWEVDMASVVNKTMAVGWNTISHYNTSAMNMSLLCGETLNNDGGTTWNASANIRYITYINESGIYVPHRCTFTLNGNLEVPRGYGYFIYVNETTNLNRTRV